jgi:hypothetical protein
VESMGGGYPLLKHRFHRMNPQDTRAQNPPAQGQATPNRPPRTRDNEAQTLGKPWGCSHRPPRTRENPAADKQGLGIPKTCTAYALPFGVPPFLKNAERKTNRHKKAH